MEAVMMVAILWLLVWRWNQIWYSRKKGLPPGTLGWPIIGETMEFIRNGPEWIKTKGKRYGDVFKTHMLGSPAVIIRDRAMNRFILMNESKGLVPGYPKSMVDILGRNIATISGSHHNYVRKNLLSLVGIPAIKDRLITIAYSHTWNYISNWDGLTLDIQAKTMEMAFLVAFKHIFQSESDALYNYFKSEFDKLKIGTLSLPINLPGTNYSIGLKARKNVVRILSEVLERRRALSSVAYNDTLDILLKSREEQKYPLSDDEEIIEQIITILYSGYETVSKTMMMSVKYLHDHPDVLRQLRDEHLAIRERKAAGQPLDWEDYKAMRFTRAVILETSRLASIINGVMRKTTQDLELNGFLIPKGWRIYVYTREVNYDPSLYSEPLEFNPWRWLQDKNLESHSYCLLFGAGSRVCPGKELGIVKVSIFLHLFLTNYRWEEVGAGVELEQFPRVEAPKGYHIKVTKL